MAEGYPMLDTWTWRLLYCICWPKMIGIGLSGLLFIICIFILLYLPYIARLVWHMLDLLSTIQHHNCPRL